MLRASLSLFVLASLTLADGNFFKVLIREVDNPAGTLLNGQSCSEFGYLGIGCNNYIQAAVSASGQDVSNRDTLSSTAPINTHGETRVSNLNLEVVDQEASSTDVLTGFDLHVLLATDAEFKNVVDNYTLHINTTDARGVYTYTSFRAGTLATTISIAWSTNIAPPSTSTPFTGSTEAPTTSPKLPVDCDEVEDKNSGVRTIYPDGSNPVNVSCEQTDHGAYTVIQSRGTSGANITFDVPFENYTDWFGEPGKGNNFWLGLDNMNALSTNGKQYSLQIDLCCGTTLIKKYLYHSFSVGDKDSQYKLSATADLPGVGLAYMSTVSDIGAPFTTNASYALPKGKAECDQKDFFDDDKDIQAKVYGGWWFGSCGNNLNGFLYPFNDQNCKVSMDTFDSYQMLGVNMRTSAGTGYEGYDVDLVSYDRVRMALFTFDSVRVDLSDDSFCL